MSAESVQHRQGQLSPQPQTVCPPPLWEALQGPPRTNRFRNNFSPARVTLLNSAPRHTPPVTVLSPPPGLPHTFLQPLNICTRLFFLLLYIFSLIVYSYIYIYL